MNRQALQEELTVQEVILDSLQDETIEDVEAQRDEARAEIVRLKRALRALPKTSHRDEGMRPRPPKCAYNVKLLDAVTSLLLGSGADSDLMQY